VNPLNARDIQITQCLMRGMREKDILRRLDFSSRSIQSFVKQARDKVGASTNAELIAKALALGLVKNPHEVAK
jgi:DNA-binding CsgD family transcriptional regulator